MRISTMVKDYIKEKIAEAYPMPTDSEYKRLFNQILEERNKFDDEMNALVTKWCYEISEKYNLPEDMYLKKHHSTYTDFSTWNCKMKKDEDKEKEYVQAKRDEAYKNIILTLELGGNKADLDRMLAELVNNNEE